MTSQEPPNDDGPPPVPRPDAGSRDKELAAQRADEIVGRREHPTQEPGELKRPGTVLAGCIMAWLGATLLLFAGITGVTYTRQAAIDGDVDPEDISSTVAFAQTAGGVSLFWAVLLVVFAFAAFRGRRWGANGLVALAAVVAAFLLYSLFSGFAIEGVTVTFWSVSSATLVRYREPSKNWYDALTQIKSA